MKSLQDQIVEIQENQIEQEKKQEELESNQLVIMSAIADIYEKLSK